MAVHRTKPGCAPLPRTVPRSSPMLLSRFERSVFKGDLVQPQATTTCATPVVAALTDAADVECQVADFVEATEGVRHSFLLSPAGRVLASSGTLSREQADQLAAVMFSLCVLAQSLDTVCGAGRPNQAMVDLRNGVLCLMAIPDGSFLAVMAEPDGDIQHVAYAATRLSARIGTLLTPEVRAELHALQLS